VFHFTDPLADAIVGVSTRNSQLLELRVMSELMTYIAPTVALAVANRETICEVSDISEVLLPDQPTRYDKMLRLRFGFLW